MRRGNRDPSEPLDNDYRRGDRDPPESRQASCLSSAPPRLERLSYDRAHLLAVRCQVRGSAPSAVTNTIRRRLPPHLTSVICRRAEQPPTKLPDQTRSTNIATVKSPTTSAPSITNTTSPADDETDTPAQPAITKNERLTILSLNILSLKPKILDLRHDLELLDCDIAVITETWLRPETSSRFITIPGFSLHRADRPDGSGHGGIAVLVKNNLKVKPTNQLQVWKMMEKSKPCGYKLPTI